MFLGLRRRRKPWQLSKVLLLLPPPSPNHRRQMSPKSTLVQSWRRFGWEGDGRGAIGLKDIDSMKQHVMNVKATWILRKHHRMLMVLYTMSVAGVVDRSAMTSYCIHSRVLAEDTRIAERTSSEAAKDVTSSLGPDVTAPTWSYRMILTDDPTQLHAFCGDRQCPTASLGTILAEWYRNIGNLTWPSTYSLGPL